MGTMNNKAFTIVELLAITTILALIFTVVLPKSNELLKDKKSETIKLNYAKLLDIVKTEDALLTNIDTYSLDSGILTYKIGEETHTIKYTSKLKGSGKIYSKDNYYGYYMEDEYCAYNGNLSKGTIKIEDNITSIEGCITLYENENN